MYTVRILTSSSRIARIAPSRAFRSSTRNLLPKSAKWQAPDAPRRDPEAHTLLEQSPHLNLKHATSSKGGKEGRDINIGNGNAAPDPELPSRKLEGPKGQTPSAARERGNKNLKRTLHTSARASAESDREKHTADSYFKDVDVNPPTSEKTFRVDGSSEATYRPNEEYGNPTKEFASISKDEPYEPPVEENSSGTGRERAELKEQKLRYGAVGRDSERDAPRRDEGPHAKDAGGRKPERKS